MQRDVIRHALSINDHCRFYATGSQVQRMEQKVDRQTAVYAESEAVEPPEANPQPSMAAFTAG